MAAAAAARGEAAVAIAAAGLVLVLGQAALRALVGDPLRAVQLGEAERRRDGAEDFEWHGGGLRGGRGLR